MEESRAVETADDEVARSMEDLLLGHKYNLDDIVATKRINGKDRCGLVVDIKPDGDLRIIYVMWFDDRSVVGYAENQSVVRRIGG